MIYNSGTNNAYAASQNLVGKKNITIPVFLDSEQKKYGWHPDQPIIVEKYKNAENARAMVGLPDSVVNADWRSKYHCIGSVMEGYDKAASTHAFAGNVISALMDGMANAGRVMAKEIGNEWGMKTSVVVDFDAAANDKEKSYVQMPSGGKFLYLGFRPYNPTTDTPDMIVGSAPQGKEMNSRTVPIYVKTCM